MKVTAVSALLWLAAVVTASPAAVMPAEDDKTTDLHGPDLPEPLTIETFDKFTSEHLTFVEFFSPYCSHCKDLAPKWVETYKNTEADQELLKIYMRQVDCVKSGDLCEREGISYFPNLRLYNAEKADGKEQKARMIDSFPRSMARTPENFRKYLINMAAEYGNGITIPSASQEVDIDLGMNIVAGEMEDPYFVALFHSTSDQWENGRYDSSCEDCAEHRIMWDKLSNLVVRLAKTGHINCLTHPLLCTKLGYPKQLGARKTAPEYAMFLPKEAGLIRLDYDGEVTVPAMKQFVLKLSANSKYEEVSERLLEEYEYLSTSLKPEPEDKFYPLRNHIALVFLYDKNQVSPEDKAIMPYLLEMVTNSPFNINLFASKSKNMEKVLEQQGNALVEYVNSDPLFEKIQYNNQLQYATTLTASPTLYMFKEGSLIPAVYQNFALEDMRNTQKIQEFINKNQYPLYGELTPQLLRHYFSPKKNANGKVVVTFVDTTNAEHLKHAFHNMSMIAHQYNALKKQYYFEHLLNERKKKHEKVAELKEKNAETVEIIQGMRVKIPHLFDHDDVIFTYVDMELYPEFANRAGWNINKRGYKAGDSIVVSKDRNYYWDTTLSGERLKNDPSALRPVLKYLLDPKLVDVKVTKFKSKLTNSPFHLSLRAADNIHQHGVLGYTGTLTIVVILYIALRRFLRRRRVSRRGIIGEPKSD